jgi:hypothetical protein
VLVPLAGCAEPRGEVTGTVTLKSQPVATAVVTFFPDQGMPAAATVQDGRYTVPNLPYGKYRVTVTPQKESPAVLQGPDGPQKPGRGGPPGKAAPAPKSDAPAIPKKYASVDSSGLTCKVEQSQVTFDIPLE